MKKNEIEVGGHYIAKVAEKLTTVKVDSIGLGGLGARQHTTYAVTNVRTGRKTMFRSAAKFRSKIRPCPTCKLDVVYGCRCSKEERERQLSSCVPSTATTVMSNTQLEAEQCSDPTGVASATEPAPASTATPPLLSAVSESATHSTIADKFASQPVTPPTAPTANGRKLTDEQRAIVETAPKVQVLVIEAGAGAGKTSTLVELAKVMPGLGQYTAFNTSLVAESKTKFPQRVACNTIHSLAFRNEGKKHSHRLGGRRVRSDEVAAMLGVQSMTIEGPDGNPKTLQAGLLTSQITRALRNFCQSADREIGTGHFLRMAGIDKEHSRTNDSAVKEYLLPFARKYWEDACDPNGKLPYQHDFYVKAWELNDPIIAAEYVLLDEAQDTSPVMLSVMEQQVRRGTRVILVGDSAQQIYSWRGAVNALAAFPDAPRLMLSQSFRFGQVVAEVANAVLSHLSEPTPLVMRGFDAINSRLSTLSEPSAILCRTNAGAVSHLLQSIADRKKPYLIGGGEDVTAFVRAARDLQQGKSTSHPELACFSSWREVEEYVKTEEGEDLKLMVKLIKDFGAGRILAALDGMPNEREADLIISTAHKSKGREWSGVKLASDFMPVSKMDDEELRLLYVAATRAQHTLDLETCPPFCGGRRDRDEEDDGDDMDRSRDKSPEVVNIGRARELSRNLPAATTPSPVTAPAPEATQLATEQKKDETADGGNTWARLKTGHWGVRGKPKQTGTVSVRRKNGTHSQEKLGKCVWEDANGKSALYEIAS